jgi:hypothetical protein
MPEVIECPPSKHEGLNSIPSIAKNKDLPRNIHCFIHKSKLETNKLSINNRMHKSIMICSQNGTLLSVKKEQTTDDVGI